MKNVPHMTSDRYYRFEGPLMDSQLSKAARPQKDKTFRSDYTVRDGCLEITNGPNLFNLSLIHIWSALRRCARKTGGAHCVRTFSACAGMQRTISARSAHRPFSVRTAVRPTGAPP